MSEKKPKVKHINLRKKVTPEKLQQAIKGSGGNITQIAKRLKVNRQTVVYCLKKRKGSSWDYCRGLFEEEREVLIDDAEKCVRDMINQRDDFKTAANTAKWLLERKKKDYRPKKSLALEGGEAPVQIEQKSTSINIDHLNLPLETRIQLLAAIEAQDKEDE